MQWAHSRKYLLALLTNSKSGVSLWYLTRILSAVFTRATVSVTKQFSWFAGQCLTILLFWWFSSIPSSWLATSITIEITCFQLTNLSRNLDISSRSSSQSSVLSKSLLWASSTTRTHISETLGTGLILLLYALEWQTISQVYLDPTWKHWEHWEYWDLWDLSTSFPPWKS